MYVWVRVDILLCHNTGVFGFVVIEITLYHLQHALTIMAHSAAIILEFWFCLAI